MIGYCDVTTGGKGRVCKEVGAFVQWSQSKEDDEIFKVYRREYKKRFAWTKTGRISPTTLYNRGGESQREKNGVRGGENHAGGVSGVAERFINASDGTILPYLLNRQGRPKGAVLPVFDAGFTVRPRHIDLESVFWRKPLYCHRKQHSFLLQAIERPHEGLSSGSTPASFLTIREGAPCAQRCPAAAMLRFL